MITADFCTAEEAKAVLFDDEIYDRITDDRSPAKEKFTPPAEGVSYIAGYVDGQIASLFIVHDEKLHFMVLKAFRLHARELLRHSFIIWPHRVYVEIPTLYRTVINFAKRAGFKEAGLAPRPHLKNGMLYDRQTLIYEG